MRLVDTSAWIEWLIASPTGKTVKSAIPVRDGWLVPTIVATRPSAGRGNGAVLDDSLLA
ncbi:hypothetical protein BH10PSE6_BH10PSE6_48260 [soil metagenome]